MEMSIRESGRMTNFTVKVHSSTTKANIWSMEFGKGDASPKEYGGQGKYFGEDGSTYVGSWYNN
jgi:hypothetical protein